MRKRKRKISRYFFLLGTPSVGTSSVCHWCHVMAHESFEDEEVADYLNCHFIAIKVDKEERPDIDSIYMSVCQKITGSGGWPLTIIMLPDQNPFFAGTYFPKRSGNHMPGLLDLLEAVEEKWETGREDLIRTGKSITNSLKQELNREIRKGKLTKDLIKNAAHSLIVNFDKKYGGFGREPKFPTPHKLMFLLRAAYYEKNEEALEVVEKTLDSMYKGGIFDHIGYGFSRYSTDSMWMVPHFEKMLYDNGLLILTYLEAYQITKKIHYRQIAEMTMEYVLRELNLKEGGFYCAQDADSEGVEGKYYVFTPDEIIDLLGKEDGAYFNDYFGITSKGNFEGKSIPNRIYAEIKSGLSDRSSDKETEDTGNLFLNETKSSQTAGSNVLHALESKRITKLRKLILDYRIQRASLHKDDKILTSWNGIMIAAFAKAYKILRDDRYLQAARKADQFIQEHLGHKDRLYVYYRENSAKGAGHIDDYSFYCWALIELYEATLDIHYLERARRYTDVMIQKFMDREGGGFYLYAEDTEPLIHRPKELYDGAIPSGNSVVSYVLSKLAAYTGNTELIRAADKQMIYIAANIADYPSAHCFSLMAMMPVLYKTKELVCVLPDSTQVREVRELLSRYFLPDVTVLIKTKGNQEQLSGFAEFTGDYKINKEIPAYYLCENHTCRSPVQDIKEIEKLLIKSK